MGSCASLPKTPDQSAMDKNDKLFIPSPLTINGGDHSVAVRPSFGSKEGEAFFDSQPWLESDGEDDFLSISNDLTPSRGSTPNHDKAPLPLVEGPKRRLSELFTDSLRREHVDDQSVVVENVPLDGEEKSAQCCLPRLRSSRSYSDKKNAINVLNQS